MTEDEKSDNRKSGYLMIGAIVFLLLLGQIDSCDAKRNKAKETHKTENKEEIEMHKETKDVFICDHCGMMLTNPETMEIHEKNCSKQQMTYTITVKPSVLGHFSVDIISWKAVPEEIKLKKDCLYLFDDPEGDGEYLPVPNKITVSHIKKEDIPKALKLIKEEFKRELKDLEEDIDNIENKPIVANILKELERSEECR